MQQRLAEEEDRDDRQEHQLERRDRADGDRRASPGPDQIVGLLHRPDRVRAAASGSF
jgi:hypothetical protein